jgi:hypothetical protein
MKRKNNINSLINKVIKETLDEKAESLVKNINELGGMDDSHPRFGKVNFAKMTPEEIMALMNEPIKYSDEEEEEEYSDYDMEGTEMEEGFDSEEVFMGRRGKDYSPKEFKRIPKDAGLSGDLPYDSMHMSKYMSMFPDDEGPEDDDDYEDEGSELVFEGETCEQCGAKGSITEGNVCEQCGNKMEGIYDKAGNFPKKQSFDYVQEEEEMEYESDEESCKYHRENFGPEDERTIMFCKGMNESLKGRQKLLDKNRNNKIDDEDFKLLRKSKKKETDEEVEEGNAFSGALAKAKEKGSDEFKVGGKTYEVKEGKKKVCYRCGMKNCKCKSKVKESVKLTESEVIDLIEKIVKEEKSNLNKGTKHKGLTTYEKAHRGSGKENSDYIKSVTKKMKEYLKDGSKGEYSMEPKIFPQGNGQLAKMSKKAYVPSDAVQDYTDNLTAAGLENLTYDEIHPNEEWVDMNVVGSSKTGNNPEWANAVDTGVNKKRNKVRKDNLLGKIKKKAYNKSPQPIVTDKSGEDAGSKLLMKLESMDSKEGIKINEEFDRMKELLSYNRKTQ